MCACLAALGCSKKTADLPVIAELPAFALVDQDSQSFDREALRGGVWVTSFVFTHCRALGAMAAHIER